MAKKETASSSVRIEKPAASRARTTKHSKASVTAAPAVEAPVAKIDAVVAESEPALAAVAAHDLYDREAIAKLAYLYAEERGFQGGSPEEDWIRAEAKVRSQKTLTASV